MRPSRQMPQYTQWFLRLRCTVRARLDPYAATRPCTVFSSFSYSFTECTVQSCSRRSTSIRYLWSFSHCSLHSAFSSQFFRIADSSLQLFSSWSRACCRR